MVHVAGSKMEILGSRPAKNRLNNTLRYDTGARTNRNNEKPRKFELDHEKPSKFEPERQ